MAEQDKTFDESEMSDEGPTMEVTPIIRRLTQRPDGSVAYFEGRSGQVTGGERSPGASIADLLRRGYVPTSNEEFARAMQRATPKSFSDDALRRVASEPKEPITNSAEGDSTMDATQGASLPPDMLNILQQYMDEGRLGELFQPYQQEQSVLDQQMQLAQGLRQRGPQRSTPTGALFGGLSNAASNIGSAMLQKQALEGQSALGKRQQTEASGRVGAILREMQRRRGVDPSTGLMAPAVDDATLANIFSGG